MLAKFLISSLFLISANAALAQTCDEALPAENVLVATANINPSPSHIVEKKGETYYNNVLITCSVATSHAGRTDIKEIELPGTYSIDTRDVSKSNGKTWSHVLELHNKHLKAICPQMNISRCRFFNNQ